MFRKMTTNYVIIEFSRLIFMSNLLIVMLLLYSYLKINFFPINILDCKPITQTPQVRIARLCH